MKASETNIVDSSAEIAGNVKIGYFNVIGKNVVISENVVIGNNNIILDGTIIGENSSIEHYVLLKDKTVIGQNCYIDSYVRSSGANNIGNEVTLRFGCTIARNVMIEDNVFISPNVMTIFSKHTGEHSSRTVIQKGAFIGTAAVVGPNITIARHVVLGAQAYASKNCDIEGAIYTGVPAAFLKMKK